MTLRGQQAQPHHPNVGQSWERPQTPASSCQTPPSAKCSARYTFWFPQWFLRVFFSIFKVQLPDEKPESLLLNLQKGLVSRSSTNYLNKKLEGFVSQNRQDRLSDYKSILDLPRQSKQLENVYLFLQQIALVWGIHYRVVRLNSRISCISIISQCASCIWKEFTL